MLHIVTKGFMGFIATGEPCEYKTKTFKIGDLIIILDTNKIEYLGNISYTEIPSNSVQPYNRGN